jgi:DNA polymerase-1
MMGRLLLIDCLGLLYRGHFALLRNPLRAPDGVNTSGINHLAVEIFSRIDHYGPEMVAAVFDYPAPSFRKDIYEEYKANRPPMPEDLKIQTMLVRELLPLLGIPVVEHEGLEADDLIASLTGEALRTGSEVIILSSDKDMLQLLGPGVTVCRPGRPGRPARELTEEDVPGEIGVRADQVVDFLALTGDSSDNVPGARGIGPKTAGKLIHDYGSLEGIYGNLQSVTPESVRKKLTESREAVDLSRKLVTLDSRLPGDISLGSLRPGPPVVPEALEMLDRLGMRQLRERVEPEQEVTGVHTKLIRSGDDLAAMTDALAEGPVSLDTETTSRRPMDADPVGISVTQSSDSAWYIPMTGDDRPDTSSVLDVLSTMAEGRGIIAQNAKYDLHILKNMEVDWPVVHGDPLIADYLLRPVASSRNISTLASIYTGRTMRSYGEVLGDSDSLLDVPVDRVAEYCCADSAAAWELSSLLGEKLSGDSDLMRIYREVELPLVRVLLSMERRGVGLDMGSLAALRESFDRRLEELALTAREMAGHEVNLASPAQVSKVLFEDLGLEPVRKTPSGGFSSSMSVLEALSGRHPFVDLVLEHRELSKLLNTYIARLPEYISPRTGLLHTSFNQTVTATGRLSSSSPNLQNIPVRTERGRMVRRCFVPGAAGEVFVSADYSQIELRVLAHLAGPGALREAYETDTDIHSATAVALFGDSSPEHRRKAKEVNFSIVYGISPYGLAQRLDVSRGEAAGIINRYIATYPEIDVFVRKTVADAEATGETRTILGRKRDFPELAGAKGSTRKSVERMVVNTTVQGSAADIVKLAMLRAHRRLESDVPGAALVLQVHDELVAVSREDECGKVRDVLVEEMENAFPLDVPLRVETGTGRNWLEALH